MSELLKPRLRGAIHQWAFAVSAGAGGSLLLRTTGTLPRIAVGVYAFSVVALFGTSALYHRRTWAPAARRWMRRLDHTMIFVLIAGTYTPFCLLVLGGTSGWVLFGVVWTGAVLGSVIQLFWPDAPKWVAAPPYLLLGWTAVVFLPAIWSRGGIAMVLLLGLGGLAYSVGAAVYALQRPNPRPAVFGYHEIFHVLTVVAAALHFVAVAVFAVPTG